jgi:subtilisin family serine protease
MRLRVLLTTIVGALVLLALTGASTAGEADESKLSAGLAQVVDEGGYPTHLPVDQLIDGYQAGDVYYLAKLRGGVDDAVVGELEDAGATIRFRYPAIGWVALVSTVDTIGAVSRHPNVTRLELDRFHEVLQITTTPAAPADQAKRGTHDVGADALWADGITGKGVVVGVADSGIDSAHPDLDDQDWLRWDALGVGEPKVQAFVDCNTSAPAVGGECTPVKGYDDNGHGTHVSGIAVGSAEGLLPGQNGKLPGMAPEASLTGAKACNAAGSCLNSAVMASLQFLATEKADGGGGADVVNVSLGSGRFYFSPLCCAEQVTNNDPEAQLVNRLAEKNNVVFTISAGNSGPFIQSVGSPSVAAQSISVAASIADFDLNHPTAETEHGVYGNIRPEAAAAGAAGIARFSSRGPSGDRLAKPDLTAPGVFYVAAEASEGAQIRSADAAAQNHYSDDPGYAVLSGTSMSAPAAAGATALVIDGYRRFAGESPAYYRVKAALANTANTRAFEGSVTGLTGSIRVKITGEDPNKLSPIRNDAWVGMTGEGAGRIHAPSALIALTKGVTVYTPQDGALDDIHELQPSWSLDAVPRGHSATQTFVVHGGPGLPKGAKVSFGVENQEEPVSVKEAPAAWFALPKSVKPMRSADVPFVAQLNVPTDAAPGFYAATIVAKVKLGDATQNVRIPVQFYVDLVDADPAEGVGTSVEEKIWASDTTDYSAVGFYAEDIYTDWVTYPVRLTEGTDRVDFSVYDVAGTGRMDVFVFDSQGQEIDSTVTGYLRTAVPGGVLNTPTSKASPARISILDGNDSSDITLPSTVWVAVSNTMPATPATFSTFHLDVDVVGGTAGTGTTPAERIHSGSHAWWSGSVGGASSHLTQSVDLTGVAASADPSLRFWAWYQLEEGYDWAYALVSTDGGASWTSLATTAANDSGTTTLNPIGDTGGVLGGSKAYPNGLTGTSGHAAFTSANLFAPTYTEHTADLSPYAGKQVTLRFLYTSDSGTHYENLYVDDVRIVDSSGTPLSVGITNPDDMETQAGWTSGGVPGFSWVTADTAG